MACSPNHHHLRGVERAGFPDVLDLVRIGENGGEKYAPWQTVGQGKVLRS